MIPNSSQHAGSGRTRDRSEEHTSELQSPCNLVCRLLLEKKKKITRRADGYYHGGLWSPRGLLGLVVRLARVECGRSAVRLLSRCNFAALVFFFLKDAAPPDFSPFPPHAALPI